MLFFLLHSTPQIQLLSQNMMDVCEWMRHSDIFSFLISPTFASLHDRKSLCSDDELRRRRRKGKEVKRELGWGIAWRGADIAGCPKALTSSMRLTQAMDRRQTGRPTCCSCPGNIQQWSEGIHGTSKILSAQNKALSLLFLPPSLSFLSPSFAASPFILHFLFSFTLSRTKPDHRHAADVMVAIVTEASQQQGSAKRVRSGGKVTMGHYCKNSSPYDLFTCLRMDI